MLNTILIMGQIEQIQRRKLILDLIQKGQTRKQIEEQVKSKFDISNTTFERDLSSAYKEISKQITDLSSNIKDLLLQRYELLWELSLNNQDLKTATQVLKQEADLTDNNTITIDKPIKIVFD